ncbi:MAG: hypothetical protein HZA03_05730 [Nitrospinae bacterium]|nr:hypothetical protein [Nitrospinota bacterium]
MPMKNNRRSFFAAAVIIALAGSAHAVKPQPPVTVVCDTVEAKGAAFQAACTIAVSGPPPVSVRLAAAQDKGTLITSSQAESASGIGKWVIVFEAHGQKPIPVLFDAHYPDGTSIRVVGTYDPYGVTAKQKALVPAGVVKDKKGGGKVKEYPSN